MAKVIGIIMAINILIAVYFGNGMFNNLQDMASDKVAQIEMINN